MSKLYAFLDIETTGLDPDRDAILEIAWFITDHQLNQITPDRTFLTAPIEFASYVIQREAIESDFVYSMHEKSGLLDSVAHRLRDEVSSPAQAHTQFARDVNEVVQPGDSLHLAGMSVHFDRNFLQDEPGWDLLFRPDQDDAEGGSLKFHHRLLDLTATKLLFEIAGRDLPEVENINAHRAINDCHEAHDMALALARELGEL